MECILLMQPMACIGKDCLSKCWVCDIMARGVIQEIDSVLSQAATDHIPGGGPVTSIAKARFTHEQQNVVCAGAGPSLEDRTAVGGDQAGLRSGGCGPAARLAAHRIDPGA